MEPAIGERLLVGLRPLPVPRRHVRALGPQLADLADFDVSTLFIHDSDRGMEGSLAHRARLAERMLLVGEEEGRAGLGEAHPLPDHHITLRISLEQRHRHRRPTAGPGLDRTEVGVLPSGFLGEELVYRWNSEEVGDLARRQPLEDLRAIEFTKVHCSCPQVDERRRIEV